MSSNTLELERQKYRLDPRRKKFSFELPEELEEDDAQKVLNYYYRRNYW